VVAGSADLRIETQGRTVINYKVEGTLAVLHIDDGKANALGTAALDSLQSALDDAERDGATAVILKGRPGVFSSGFDLEEVRSDPSRREAIRLKFVDLLIRLFDYERPVIAACTGHALAAGAALLLVADRRIGIEGRFKLGFNEAAIGVPISGVTVELARYRMPMPWFESLVSGQTFAPEQAVPAGLLDSVVPNEDELVEAAEQQAQQLGKVDLAVFRQMKGLARSLPSQRARSERDLLRSAK
jgi:enoyl-CoA hydratase